MSETTIKSFGIVINKFNIDQQDYIINFQLNKMMKKYCDISPVIFFSEYAKNAQPPLFARFPIKEAYCYKNPIIATNIESAILVKNCVCVTRKILYLWDLEWMYNPNYSFEIFAEIYHSFEIIVRSNSHYQIFKKLWKQPDSLIEDFNYEQIRDYVIK